MLFCFFSFFFFNTHFCLDPTCAGLYPHPKFEESTFRSTGLPVFTNLEEFECFLEGKPYGRSIIIGNEHGFLLLRTRKPVLQLKHEEQRRTRLSDALTAIALISTLGNDFPVHSLDEFWDECWTIPELSHILREALERFKFSTAEEVGQEALDKLRKIMRKREGLTALSTAASLTSYDAMHQISMTGEGHRQGEPNDYRPAKPLFKIQKLVQFAGELGDAVSGERVLSKTGLATEIAEQIFRWCLECGDPQVLSKAPYFNSTKKASIVKDLYRFAKGIFFTQQQLLITISGIPPPGMILNKIPQPIRVTLDCGAQLVFRGPAKAKAIERKERARAVGMETVGDLDSEVFVYYGKPEIDDEPLYVQFGGASMSVSEFVQEANFLGNWCAVFTFFSTESCPATKRIRRTK